MLVIGGTPSPAAAADDHAEALAALVDIKAAIGALVQADKSYSTDRDSYHTAARHAVDSIVGGRDPAYGGHPAAGADEVGALGHIDLLLDRTATPVWAEALRGADANLRGRGGAAGRRAARA